MQVVVELGLTKIDIETNIQRKLDSDADDSIPSTLEGLKEKITVEFL